MKRTFLIFILATAVLIASCGGGGSNPTSSALTPQSSSLEGSWEFIAQSTADGSTTLIEANLNASQESIRASGPSQVQTATYQDSAWWVNGSCPSQAPGQNSILGSLAGNVVSLTFNQGGNVFTGTGTMNGNSITGTWSGTNSNCADSGTFTAKLVPSLSGIFTGTLTFLGNTDNVTATLSEGAGYSLRVDTHLSGADNGDFTLTGTAVANVAFASGSLNGSPISLFGYFDGPGQYTGVRNSIAVFDYDTLIYEGLLTRN